MTHRGRGVLVVLGVLGLVLATSFAVRFMIGNTWTGCRAGQTGPIAYSCRSVLLLLPAAGQSSTTPTVLVFEGITFELWLENWYGPGGGTLKGRGTEPNDSGYAFSFYGGPMVNPPATWIAPDGKFGAQWDGTGSGSSTIVRLLVAA